MCLVGLSNWAKGQIVINEIMFNPPESGTDFLEYIEFYNSGNQAVNLKNYSISDAVVFTFPDTVLEANSYIVICVDAFKFDSIFGVQALEWTSGGLRNTDEVITLLDSTKTVVDSVHYYSSWSPETNGNGASLELCRSDVDNNNETYWHASINNLTLQVNGKALMASPGSKNSGNCADRSINVSDFKFDPADIEIYIGEKIEWINKGGHHNVNGSKTTFPTNPESFSSGSPSTDPWSFIYKFNQAGIYNYQCDVHASNGMKGIVRVKVRDNLYPDLPIGTVSSTDFNGVADSLNKRFSIEGVVYGVNLRPTGLQFTMIDRFNDGIAVFLTSGNLNYTVTEGDLIRVKGLISQFNGLVQILPDSIIKLSTGNTLFQPTIVNYLNESTESQLVHMKKVELVDPMTWSNNPLGFTVKVTDGVNNFDMRIDNDVNIHGTPAPLGPFELTGLGSQFDAINPFLEGYQIQPRYLTDIKLIVDADNPNNDKPIIYPNPVLDKLYISNLPQNPGLVDLFTIQGKFIESFEYKNPLVLHLLPGIYLLKLKNDPETNFRFVKL